MVIELQAALLLARLKAISHKEVAEIPDVEARYRAEAGTEKESELKQDIGDAAAMLSHRVSRYLKRTYARNLDYVTNWPDAYVYEFEMSERRLANKGEALTVSMANFVLHYALSVFYSNVSQVDLSNKHSLLTQAAETEIEKLIYTKLPPSV